MGNICPGFGEVWVPSVTMEGRTLEKELLLLLAEVLASSELESSELVADVEDPLSLLLLALARRSLAQRRCWILRLRRGGTGSWAERHIGGGEVEEPEEAEEVEAPLATKLRR